MSLAGSWAPFARPTFRFLWSASLIAYIGVWCQDLAANWLMASATSSALLIALVPASSSLPYFFLAFPAGVVADSLSRKRMLIMSSLAMAAVSLVMGFWVGNSAPAPILLLVYVFLVGACDAFFDPVWKGLVPELVDASEQSAAFALDGVSVNLARALGPAIAGVLIARFNPSVAFFVNAGAFGLLTLAILSWQAPTRPVSSAPLTWKRFTVSFRTGIQFARFSRPLRFILLRCLLFLLPASALWAMAPIVGRRLLELSALEFGLLMGSGGLGAVFVVHLIPVSKAKLGLDGALLLAQGLFLINLVAMATLSPYPVLCVTMALAGAGWVLVLATFQSSIIPASPSWARGRAIALYSLTFFGAVSAGSALWGLIANSFGASAALGAAAVVLTATSLVALRFPLPGLAVADTGLPPPTTAYPALPRNVGPDEGPILVELDYVVDPANSGAFLAKIGELAEVRRKYGAYHWTVFENTPDTTWKREQFLMASWSEFEELFKRITPEDQVVFAEMLALTRNQEKPAHRQFKLKDIV